MESIVEINNRCGSDKSKYNPIYAEYLEGRREAVKDLLEIGIYHGASIRMWLDYFPNAKVYGIDNNSLDKEGVSKYVDMLVGPRFEYWIGDGANHDFLKKVIGGKQFDVVIDDASHRCVDQVCSFNFFKKHIKPGGYYFCEDIPIVDKLEEWWCFPYTYEGFEYVGIRKAHGSEELLAIFKKI